MAKIRLDLSQFKASGVYTVEFDQSESIVLNTQTTRLVVGFSKKGPINAPVFCQDVKTAKRIFGEIDTTLEARGSFFHRSLFTCLETGPCFALVLTPLNDDETSANPDYDIFKTFSLSTTEANGATVSKLYSSYFNKEKFYFPDTTYFLANVANSANEGQLFSFVNLGQIPFSVIVRKTGDLTGFNVSARDWFGAGNVPSYIREFDFISEYFVQIDIVQGDWTNLAQLSVDPVFSAYFDSKGLMKDKITAFLNSPDVRTLGSFSGCMIPNLVDGNGTNYSIDTIINNNVATTGLFVALNEDALDNYDPTDTTSPGRMDMVGHTLIGSSEDNIDFLSYNFAAKETFDFGATSSYTTTTINFGPTASTNLPGATGDAGYTAANSGWVASSPAKVAYFKSFYGTGNEGKFNNLLYIKKDLLSATQQESIESLVAGTSLVLDGIGATQYATVTSLTEGTDNSANVYIIGISHPDKALEGTTSGKNAAVLSSSATQIFVSGTAANADINVGDWIFANNSGVRYYYRVTAIGLTGSNTAITVDATVGGAPSAVPINTFYTVYWESTKSTAGSLFDIVNVWTNTDAPFKYVVSPATLTYSSSVYTAHKSNDLYQKFATGILSIGDYVYSTLGATGASGSTGPAVQLFISPSFTRDSDNVEILQLSAFYDAGFVSGYTGSWSFNTIVSSLGVFAGDLKVYSLLGDFSSSIAATFNSTYTKAYIDAADVNLAQVGNYLVADPLGTNVVSDYVLTRIVSKKKMLSGANIGKYELTVNQPLANYNSYTEIVRYKKVQDAAPGVQFTYLPGFKLGAYHLPGTKAQLAKILGMLDEANSNISVGLADRNVITFRYLVDTFTGGLDIQSYPKNYLSKLAKQRQKCMAIINCPTIQEFIESTDPRFTEVPTNANPKPLLKTSYIAEGGNLSLGPSFVYSLPDEVNGAKFAGFFSPNLIIRDNNKNISIPPAADVSNNFIRKFLNGQPYSIVAGPRRGVLSNPRLAALEYDFTDDDRANLEPLGWNPIIYRNNVGFMIYGNQTAYQKTLTAYNNLHVRDLLITVEEAIEDVLNNYVFEFNDSTTRLEIKSIVDKFLDNVRSAGGIYDYRTIMDTTNNTNEIIDQNFAIIDVGIEPARGAQKFINRITVLKTGQISSGGFTVA
jgi:hypothetical protein